MKKLSKNLNIKRNFPINNRKNVNLFRFCAEEKFSLSSFDSMMERCKNTS
jgi:hypothetical protein